MSDHTYEIELSEYTPRAISQDLKKILIEI